MITKLSKGLEEGEISWYRLNSANKSEVSVIV